MGFRGIGEQALEGGLQRPFVRDVLVSEALQGRVIRLEGLVGGFDSFGSGHIDCDPMNWLGTRQDSTPKAGVHRKVVLVLARIRENCSEHRIVGSSRRTLAFRPNHGKTIED